MLRVLQHGHEQNIKNYMRLHVYTLFTQSEIMKPNIKKKDTDMNHRITPEALNWRQS